MKCSTRVKLAVVGAVLAAVFLAGAAWAGETEVVAAINNYVGLTASGNGSGTITVTGTKTNATTTLNLGDISGLTINWQAQVTGDVNTFAPAPEGDHIQLITIFGTGTFNIQSS